MSEYKFPLDALDDPTKEVANVSTLSFKVCKRCGQLFSTFLDISSISPLGKEKSTYCCSCLTIKCVAVYLIAKKQQLHIAKYFEEEAEKLLKNPEQISI